MRVGSVCGYCLASAVLVLMGGCADDNFRAVTGSATITPYITVDPRIIVEDGDGCEYKLPEIPDADEFSLILTDKATGRVAEWERLADFDTDISYRSGSYALTAYYGSLFSSDGDNSQPTYYGTTTFDIPQYGNVDVNVSCMVSCAILNLEYLPEIDREFKSFSAVLHVAGGGYIACKNHESHNVCLNPGEILISFDMTLPDGRHALVEGPRIGSAEAAHYYRSVVGVEDNGRGRELKISFYENTVSDDTYVSVTDELFTAARPTVTPVGFTSGQPVMIAEGSDPSSQLAMNIGSISLRSLVLTTRSTGSMPAFWPTEIDLLHIDTAMADSLSHAGLSIVSRSANDYTIDFSGVPRHMSTGLGAGETTFYLVAVNNNGEMSDPLTLSVLIRPVELKISEVSPLLIGAGEVSMVVEAPQGDIERNLKVEIYDDNKRSWLQPQRLEVTPADGGMYNLLFSVSDGTSPLDVRLIYCGDVMAETTIERISPEFTVVTDPFATKAVVKILPVNPDHLSLITERVYVYSGDNRLPVVNRDLKSGTITVNGLEENHPYRLKFTMHAHPVETQFVTMADFRTESAAGLPNGDFEDYRDEIDYKNLPSGGRYSQNYVEIFNRQNYTTHHLKAPESWANTNAKTFCRNAKVYNTWYMQPSCYIVDDAASGAYAVKLVTVGWDIDGFPIPDYLQESQPFVPYSRNVPSVNFASPGQLFLGSYSFNYLTCTEQLSERHTFRSRPSALNGYYKYEPGQEMPDDHGMARIEVIGEVDGNETVIAEGTTFLVPSATYATFSVPLVYTMFGVKATGIRVMLASSPALGSIASQTNSIRLHYDMPSASATASQLWIDALTLSY